MAVDGMATLWAKLRAPNYKNREIVLSTVKQDGCLLACAPRFRSDRAVVLEAMKQHGLALDGSDASLRCGPEVIIEPVKQKGLAWAFVRASVREDGDLALLAFRKNPAQNKRWLYAKHFQAAY